MRARTIDGASHTVYTHGKPNGPHLQPREGFVPMNKHQGQRSASKTSKYSRPSQSGATKHQTATAAGRNDQSTAKSVHQGQHGGRGSTGHQGDPRKGTSGTMARKGGGGSIAGHKGSMRTGKSSY